MKWTLDRLSELSEVDIGTISALEKRDSRKSEYAGQIAAAFGLSVDQLMDPSRDWLQAAEAQQSDLRVGQPTPEWRRSEWPFSAELRDAIAQLPQKQIHRLENLLRVSLDLPTVPGSSRSINAAAP